MNESGIYPIDNRVVVLPEKLEEVTAGGIVLTAQTRDQHDMGHVKATLVAVGSQAFEDIEDKKQRPKEGCFVSIAKFAGYLLKGKDGADYRVINDRDVVAMLDGNWDVRSTG